ncbi:F5, partial [Symbiodinium necroappetens]
AKKKATGNDNETKKPPKKPVNFAGRANAKLNSGRTTVTDSKYWIRVIEEDQKQPEEDKRKVLLALSKQLAEGYVSQLKHYQGPIEAATDALDMKLIEGCKDEKSLQPLMTVLDTAVENYTTAVRPIRALFETLPAIMS